MKDYTLPELLELVRDGVREASHLGELRAGLLAYKEIEKRFEKLEEQNSIMREALEEYKQFSEYCLMEGLYVHMRKINGTFVRVAEIADEALKKIEGMK